MNNYEFYAEKIICNGKTFPVEYSVSPTKTVFIFAVVPGKPEPVRIRFAPDHELYSAALAAAESQQSNNAPHDPKPEERPKTICEDKEEEEKKMSFAGMNVAFTGTCPKMQRKDMIAHVRRLGGCGYDTINTSCNFLVVGEKPGSRQLDRAARWSVKKITWQEWWLMAFGTPAETDAETPPDPVREPAQEERRENISQAADAIPEKSFVGSTIQGKGWRILFDEKMSRTRIIFDDQPTPKAQKAMEKAGFYFSRLHNSWNKKLTWKAYRAAQELTGKLNKIYA